MMALLAQMTSVILKQMRVSDQKPIVVKVAMPDYVRLMSRAKGSKIAPVGFVTAH